MKRPVVFVVMDGIGLSENIVGNAVKASYTPTLDRLMSTLPTHPFKLMELRQDYQVMKIWGIVKLDIMRLGVVKSMLKVRNQ